MSLSDDAAAFVARLNPEQKQALFGDDAFGFLESCSEYHALVAELSPRPVEQNVLWAIRAMVRQRETSESSSSRAEIVVTTPEDLQVPARRTHSVVREMVENAKREILVAGYAVSGGGGLPDLLAGCSQRVGSIKILCGDWANDSGSASSDAFRNWPEAVRKPQMFVPTRRDESGAMHMKILIVDAEHLFVSSANFTARGMGRNFEFGVRLSGKIAAQAASIFDGYASSSHFRLLQ
jgi:phosphatidylserine/phosphatidylglycerophosphate/cardiolipin synthase-like enzyme